jgi:hypothetical protein
LAHSYDVERVPTGLLFRDARRVERWVGVRDRQVYEAALLAALP